MKTLKLELYLSKAVATHILGGLAQSFREMVGTEANDAVVIGIRSAIRDILLQLHEQGEDVMNARSPFNAYARLIRFNVQNYVV